MPAGSLLNKQVFLYDYIDAATTDAKVFVCIEVDDGNVRGPAVTGAHLWIYIAVPKSMMNMDGEIRRDALAQRIDELLNGNMDFGFGKLERKPGGRIVLHDSFRGRFLHYYVLDWNRHNSTPLPWHYQRLGRCEFEAIRHVCLYFGDDYAINDKILIRQPTMGEIVEYGEQEYFSMAHMISSISSDFKPELTDMGLDYEKITDIEMFYIATRNMPVDKTRILFGELEFHQTQNVRATQ